MIQPMHRGKDKIKSLEELREERKRLGKAGKRVVLTNGHFELLHPGHVRYLEQAREMGDCLFVGLNADEVTRRLKGPGRPVLGEMQRAEVLAALQCVDYVTIFAEDTAEHLVSVLKPDVYVKGGDYENGKALPEAEIVREYGGKVAIAPLAEGYSTTALLNEIAKRLGPDRDKHP